MLSITQEKLPHDSLLTTYRSGVRPERWGRYGDCFSVTVDSPVSLAEFVFAFYTSPAFRIERLMLGAFARAPSSDAGALALAEGASAAFAIWYTGARTTTQLLMCDRYERTRSWFRVVPVNGDKTQLQFGSAAARDNGSSDASLGGSFRLLLGFHVVYSQVLLHAAKVRVVANVHRRLRGNRK